MVAQDAEGRVLHTVFQLLPSKKRYPEYYEVIDNPIDLKIIATRIQRAQYSSLSDLERDLLLMTKNACTFNEPGSQIYKDAKALRKIITARKIEIEQGRSSSGKSSERIRNKRLRGSQCLSAVTSALKYEEEDEEEDAEEEPEEDVDEQDDEEGEEPMEEDEDEEGDEDDEGGADEDEESSPLWQLFESVRSYSCGSNQGYLMSDPFRKLPSKRYYPDYYKEIKNPISLFQIRSKLKQGHYGTLSELAGDLNIMFENAKKYNRADSQLYKDAVKLQKVMQSKVQELLEYDQDSDSDEDEERSVKRRGPKGPRGRKPQDETLKKRFLQLYRILIDHMEEGRQPILMFMEKPSKKLYPDYYQVIAEPIDMLTIEANIKNDKYTSEDQLLSDFKLMFNNCRQYNEEGSVIYEDANKLERLMMEQAQSSPSSERRFVPRSAGPKVKKLQSVLYNKLRILFEAVKEHKDPKGRQLSVIFNKLPSKVEYPDYYEVIKRPIDLEKISQKLKNGGYETLEDMVSDFVLMFDNACKYNEPDSQIYKVGAIITVNVRWLLILNVFQDALMLQRVTLQTKLHLREDEGVPDVPAAVQEMLTSLFTATYNHQDEEGRCFSDSMAELPEHDDVDGKKVRAISLDLIKRRLDRNLYKRLDLFQEDMFACLDRARRLSRSDSQVFEDAIELQAYFIKQRLLFFFIPMVICNRSLWTHRDELCRGGDLLHSPALRYSAQELAASLEALRQEKALRELPEEEGETRSSEDSFKEQVACATQGEEMSFNQQLYRVGDFVYLEPKERGMEPHIIHIERLWTNQDNQQMLFGNYFYRPNETYHLTTRKFLEKEVFKSDVRAAVPLQQVVGVCYVLSVRDYLKLRPEGIPDKDVYVCESRYASKARSFKKIKIWPYTLPDHIPLVPREEPLEPKRVMSVFRERVEKHKEEIAELEEGEKIPEREPPPNVEIFNPQAVDGNTYYEQHQLLHCDTISSIKTGDCVYVQTSPGCKCVAQVDSVWVNKDGEQFFKGPWFVPPSEIPHEPSRLFYKQELFLSSLEDSHSLNDILGRCAVLEHGELLNRTCTFVSRRMSKQDAKITSLDEMASKSISTAEMSMRMRYTSSVGL
ncbi:hypothetical protein B566_EDAN005901 [Ephemera danica]|nr:hypothetical protein B566_EDAN005901 [Ephemera danica]